MKPQRTNKKWQSLEQGDTARMQPQIVNKKWEKATVLREIAPRSYAVRSSDGRTSQGDHQYLRRVPTEENSRSITNDEEDNEPLDEMIEDNDSPLDDMIEDNDSTATDQEVGTGVGTGVVTRSGRWMRPPAWIEDYDVTQGKVIRYCNKKPYALN